MVSPFRQDVNDLGNAAYGLAQDSANTVQNWANGLPSLPSNSAPTAGATGTHNLSGEIAGAARGLYNGVGTAATGVLNAGRAVGDVVSGAASGAGTAAQLAGQEATRYFSEPVTPSGHPQQYDAPKAMTSLPGMPDMAKEAGSWNAAADAAWKMQQDIHSRDMLKDIRAKANGPQPGEWQAPTYYDARNPETAPLDTAATRAQSLYDRNPAGMHAQMFPAKAPILQHAGANYSTHLGGGGTTMGGEGGVPPPTVTGSAPMTQQTPMGNIGSHFMGQAPQPLRPSMNRMVADHSRMGMSAKATRKFV